MSLWKPVSFKTPEIEKELDTKEESTARSQAHPASAVAICHWSGTKRGKKDTALLGIVSLRILSKHHGALRVSRRRGKY